MAEARNLPLKHWGEEIRRGRSARRALHSRLLAAALSAAMVTALVVTLVWQPRPRLIWNASASAPVGLYAVTPPRDVRTGEMVIAWLPEPARSIAAARHYLPANVPLVKRVAAAGGDRVCGVGEALWVNGRHVAVRPHADAIGRPMPLWTGCRELAPEEYFLLMDHPGSFDGRYFGPTQRRDLVGRAVLLWAR